MIDMKHRNYEETMLGSAATIREDIAFYANYLRPAAGTLYSQD